MKKAELYSDYRCADCKKLLLKGVLIDSEIQVKCSRCKKLVTLKGDEKSKYMCYVEQCPSRVK